MAAIDIKKEAKTPCGAYLLFGEEDYLKRHYAGEIRRAVVGDSPYAPFNHILFSPDSFTAGAAADALATPPVFEEKKLIELCAFNFNELKAAETTALCDFLEEAKNYDYAVILINIPSGALDYGIAKSGKISRPSALFKALDAAAKTAYFPRAGLRQLTAWADKHFGTEGIKAGEAELRALIGLAGSDMMTLAGEIEKLCAYLHTHGRSQLTEADIEAVCCETGQLEPFGLSNAILAGDPDGALAILCRMEEKRARPAAAFAGIYGTYIDLYRIRVCLDDGMRVPDIAKRLKMNEYRAKIYAAAAAKHSLDKISAVLSLCQEADLQIKSESSDFGRLETLVCEAARL